MHCVRGGPGRVNAETGGFPGRQPEGRNDSVDAQGHRRGSARPVALMVLFGLYAMDGI